MAIIARDPVVVTLTTTTVQPVARDAIGHGASPAPVVSNQVPVPGAINQLPTVVITFEVD